jgi:hypothetical protein
MLTYPSKAILTAERKNRKKGVVREAVGLVKRAGVLVVTSATVATSPATPLFFSLKNKHLQSAQFQKYRIDVGTRDCEAHVLGFFQDFSKRLLGGCLLACVYLALHIRALKEP